MTGPAVEVFSGEWTGETCEKQATGGKQSVGAT